MREASRKTRLVEKHRDVRLVVGEFGLELLQDHDLFEASRPLSGRQVHVAPSSACQLRHEVISPDFASIARYARCGRHEAAGSLHAARYPPHVRLAGITVASKARR